jgi:hypothetical protein
MGRAGRTRVVERYQLDTTVATYYARYSQAVARLRNRGGEPRAVPV